MQYRYYATVYSDAVRVFPGGIFLSSDSHKELIFNQYAKENDYLNCQIPDTAALLTTGKTL